MRANSAAGDKTARTGSGQFNRKRQPVEPLADLRYRVRMRCCEGEIGPNGSGALHKEFHCGIRGQMLDRSGFRRGR